MGEPYSVINQCLLILKQSDLPITKKLHVEIQLIQMKRLLLNDAIPREGAPCRCCEEDMFKELLRQMQMVCKGDIEGGPLADLMDSIDGMLVTLGTEQHIPD
jgi:hypothetical protein